ncbi:MAG: Crp/Fnr family transcriptional regulator [Chloroflexota bacterium]
MAASGTRRTAAEALSAVSYFNLLDDHLQHAISDIAIRRHYEAEEVVFLEGEACTGLHVVEEGWLKAIKISPEGREQVLRFVGPAGVVNEVGVFAKTPNPATVVTLTASTLWVIDRDAMLALLEEYPQLAQRVVQRLARRVLHLVSLVEDLSLRTVEARLARYLLERADDQTLERERWATQAEMASRLGTVLDVLNRALHQLAREGLIDVQRHEIRILDQEGLRTRAGTD